MDRKEFMISGGLLSAAFLLEGAGLLQAKAGDNGPVNIGVIGCGQRGQGIMYVLKELKEHFKITAFCDVLDFRFEESRKSSGLSDVKIFRDHRKLLDDQTIKAVVIAVPLYEHFAIAKDALEAGKHVYLEKTMTHNIPQALELLKTAQSRPKQILQVGHQYRYSPLYYQVRDMIKKGYLGKVVNIESRWDRNGSWRRPLPSPSLERQINWRMYKEYSGGLAAELLSHQIDFINWAFDTHPDEIFATGGIDYYKDGREVFDNLQATLRYDKAGMTGNFGAVCSNSYDGFLFRIKGDKGTVSLLVDKGVYYPEKEQQKALQTVDGVTGATKLEWNKDGGINIDAGPLKDGTWYAFKDFYNSISTGNQPASNVITGAKTAIAVHMINASSEVKMPQQWKSEYNL